MCVCVCLFLDIIETAYIRALQVAVIAHTVAKACGTQTLVSCGCSQFNTNNMAQVSGNTYSGNCSDNLDFGYQFAMNFTTSGVTSTTVQAKTDLHNFKAGITVSTLQFHCVVLLPTIFFMHIYPILGSATAKVTIIHLKCAVGSFLSYLHTFQNPALLYLAERCHFATEIGICCH